MKSSIHQSFIKRIGVTTKYEQIKTAELWYRPTCPGHLACTGRQSPPSSGPARASTGWKPVRQYSASVGLLDGKAFLLILMFLWMSFAASSQQILLDEPVRAGELTLFRDVRDANTYYYVSDKPRLATENGKPQFSFLRYVDNVRSATEEAREGEGGGIVHAVVSLSVTEEQLQQARQALRSINPDGTIKGPVIFKGGTIALISSFANASGELTRQVIGLGTAPILDGANAAVSVELTRKGAQILWESFQTPTPDMSISFEMEVSGYLSPRQALIEANFEQIYEHQSFASAVVTPVLAAEINAAFDEMIETGAIKVTQIGEDENMEKLLEAAYSKLTKMMFEQTGGTGTPNLNQLTATGLQGKSMLDRATEMLGKARSEAKQENERLRREARETLDPDDIDSAPRSQADASKKEANKEFSPPKGVSDEEASRLEQKEKSRAPQVAPEQISVPALAIAASFQMKKVRHQGVFKIDLNKYTADNLTLRFDENFGQINCQECFHQVNLDDPLYKQRELFAYLDGMNSEDFDKYINYVSVVMRKKHEGGDLSHDELRVDRINFNSSGNHFKMLYGWKQDNNRSKWLDYEYRTEWNFFGGHKVASDWQSTDVSTIPLSPPFRRRIIDLEADPALIADAKVRTIEVNVFYKLGESEQFRQVRLNTRADQFSQQVEIIQPPEQTEYEYEITWHILGSEALTSGRKSSNNAVLFVDNIPL